MPQRRLSQCGVVQAMSGVHRGAVGCHKRQLCHLLPLIYWKWDVWGHRGVWYVFALQMCVCVCVVACKQVCLHDESLQGYYCYYCSEKLSKVQVIILALVMILRSLTEKLLVVLEILEEKSPFSG